MPATRKPKPSSKPQKKAGRRSKPIAKPSKTVRPAPTKKPRARKSADAKPKTTVKIRPLDLSSFPAESITVLERWICLACVWDVFTRHLKLAPRTARAEIKRYTPSISELCAPTLTRPWFNQPPRCLSHRRRQSDGCVAPRVAQVAVAIRQPVCSTRRKTTPGSTLFMSGWTRSVQVSISTTLSGFGRSHGII
jgi:hypothetical protein